MNVMPANGNVSAVYSTPESERSGCQLVTGVAGVEVAPEVVRVPDSR